MNSELFDWEIRRSEKAQTDGERRDLPSRNGASSNACENASHDARPMPLQIGRCNILVVVGGGGGGGGGGGDVL